MCLPSICQIGLMAYLLVGPANVSSFSFSGQKSQRSSSRSSSEAMPSAVVSSFSSRPFVESKTKLSAAYHPLRKNILSGNPNAPERTSITTPLQEYLNDHGICLDAFNEYRNKLIGTIVTPLDGEQYAKGRQLADNVFDKYPLWIAYCNDVADVVATIEFAQSQSLKVSNRAGGHSTAGYSALDDSIVIDVTSMAGIHVNPKEMKVTVGSGVRWGMLNHALDAYGLHTPGGSCSDVGCCGFTLGGGYGYTAMKYGMTCDQLIEVTVVAANGEVVVANEQQNSDLYWGHRGGTGGNFGVVVSLTYKLHNLKKVWPIYLNWPIEDAAIIMKTWQDEMTKNLQDRNLGLLGFLATREVECVDEKGRRQTKFEQFFAIRGMYSGENVEDGKIALSPLTHAPNTTVEYPEDSPQMWTKQYSYSSMNEHLLDNVEGVIPDTVKETKRCSLIERALGLEEYQEMVDYFRTTPNEFNILSLEPYGGAINEMAPDKTAFVHRDAYFDIFVDSFWPGNTNDDDEEKEAFTWLDRYFNSRETKKLWSNHYYQNYPNSNYTNWQEGYFGSNYPRLQEVKAKWDPDNFFRYEQSIELPRNC